MQHFLYLVAYDISDAKRLRAILQLLRPHIKTGQLSVYEVYLSQQECEHLLEDVSSLLDLNCDQFFIIQLNPRNTVIELGYSTLTDGYYLLPG